MPVAVIVDGYSTGRHLAEELDRHGWQSVHVMSSPSPPVPFSRSFTPQSYTQVMPHDSDVRRMAEAVAGFKPRYVVAGAESGVDYADRLARALDLPGNDPQTSHLRRDKFAMIERIRSCGLAAANQHLFSGDESALRAWLSATDMPVVVKPTSSSGSDDVSICDDPETAIASARSIVGKVNRLGLRNRAALVQSYLGGQQYVLNSVSMDGQAAFTDVWRIHQQERAAGANIADYKLSVDRSDANFEALADYTKRCLDALDLRFGAGHAELRLTEDGPVLVEIGARTMGATMARDLFHEAFGHSQVSYWVDCLRAGKIDRPVRHDRTIHMGVAHFNFSAGGTVRSTALETLRSLPSFRRLEDPPAVGDRIEHPRTDGSGYGYCYMLNKDKQALQRDMAVYEARCDDGSMFVLD